MYPDTGYIACFSWTNIDMDAAVHSQERKMAATAWQRRLITVWWWCCSYVYTYLLMCNVEF
jgi:hypothetical protein